MKVFNESHEDALSETDEDDIECPFPKKYKVDSNEISSKNNMGILYQQKEMAYKNKIAKLKKQMKRKVTKNKSI